MKQQESYYGIYFWLTLITFAVPLFVAYSAFEKLAPTTKPVPNPDASGVDHQLWDYLLKSYVKDGLVDYEGFRRDYIFKIYLRQLGGADFGKLSTEDEKLALYCNAYNAFVINGVIKHQVKESVNEFQRNGVGFFDLREHILGNQTVSLNELEHQIIRPRFNEPRIHLALVCAALSCPAIRPEAFDGPRLNEQLRDQAVLFANHRKHVNYDAKTDQILLNSILKWYGEDWDSVGGYLTWLAGHVKDPELQAKLLAAKQGLVAVDFVPYDWSLNGLQTISSERYRRSEAGSGTIPNE